MKASQLKETLAYAIKNKLPVLIKGAPGTGKSDLVAQACHDAGANLIISHPVVSDPTDFKGLPFPVADKDEATFLPFGDLLRLIHRRQADRLYRQYAPLLEPSLLFAICGALVQQANRKNFGQILTYAERIPPEFQVLLVNDAQRRQPVAIVLSCLRPVGYQPSRYRFLTSLILIILKS